MPPSPWAQAPPALTCTRGIGKAARSKAVHTRQRVKFPAKGVKRKTLSTRLKTTMKPLLSPWAPPRWGRGAGARRPAGPEGGSVRVWEVFRRNGEQACEDSWARAGAVLVGLVFL